MSSATFELSPERWARIQSLFDGVTALPAAQREAWLSEHCGDDPALRDYVASLVLADPGVDATVEQTIAGAARDVFGEPGDNEVAGETIGPYRIERLLGEGGMGMVYLASRADEQFEQQVAIKLGRHRLIDPQTEYRLRHERQILADLDHPGIARLFDGGTTNEGVPYIVMEYIDGVRIDTYCDLHRLGINDRLELFRQICLAVHHAHQNLIIHRDIKPSNILVTEDGTPKLLDFGIAKLTDAAGAATQGLTQEGAVVMTPANATPEQILGQPVTTATDVYGLGLLLYRLLSGVRPFNVESMTPSDIARWVCEETLPAPSVRLQRLRRGPGNHAAARARVAEIAHGRRLSEERLVRRLRGDLDTIIMQALSKEPARRYRSAGALAEDTELHLKSMPIQARRDAWTYRTAKFVRRHYVGVAASALIASLLVAFSIVVSVQNRTIAAERDTAREVSRFLEDIFRARDPVQARGANITANELLAEGSRRIRQELTGQPEIQSTLMATMGRAYYNLGEYDDASGLLQQALDLSNASFGSSHPDIAVLQNDLAKTLIRVPEYARAEELLTSALRYNAERYGEDSVACAENLFQLAELHLKKGEIAEAERYAESSIALYEAFRESHPIDLAKAKSILGRILQVRGDLDRTEALLLEAIDILEREGGNDHPWMAYFLQNLGVLQRSRGDLDEAEASFDAAIAATQRIMGRPHTLIAATLINKGSLLHERADLEQAEAVIREALAMHIETLGPEHPMVGYDQTFLGMVLHDRGDVAGAEATLNAAIDLYERILDPGHQYTASAMTELGAVLNTRGRSDRAVTLLEEALAIRLKDYPPDHPLVAATRAELGDAWLRLGDHGRAEELLTSSTETLADTPGRRRERARAALERLEAALSDGVEQR